MIGTKDAMRIEDIHQTGDTQIRAQLDMYAVNDYAEAMRNGDVFPHVDVFFDGQTYWLADGFHRIAAAESIDRNEIDATVHQGGKREAILFAIDANRGHGVRITRKDKRRMVEMILKDEEWREWPLNQMARQCGVSVGFVHKLSQEITSFHNEKIEKPTVRKATRNGKTYTIDTTNIGKPAPETEPETVADLWAANEERKREQLEDAQAAYEEWKRDPSTAQPWEEVEAELDAQYADSPPITVINGDAQYLSDHISEPVHLVITSPPYNVGIDYDIHSDDISTYIPLITSVWKQCFDVMAEGARIAVVVPFGVGRNPYIPFDSQIMVTLQDAGFTLRGRIVWDKNTTGNRTSWGSFRIASNPALRDTTECIIVAHKGEGKLPIPDDHKYKDDKGTFTAWLADGDYFMELAQDHWAIAPESAQRVKHPAPFPTELVNRLIHFYGYPGCHVVDPFGGSGTVGVAAKGFGCQATLFEISAEYAALAEKRIANGI